MDGGARGSGPVNRAEDEAGAAMSEPYLTEVGWAGSALRVAGAIRLRLR